MSKISHAENPQVDVVAESNVLVTERDAVVAERDAVVAERDMLMQELYRVYHSPSWKITRFFRIMCSVARLCVRRLRVFFFLILPAITWIRMGKGIKLLSRGEWRAFKSSVAYVGKPTIAAIPVARVYEELLPSPLDIQQPIVSVVIPCFNYGNFVEDAIDSVLAQTLKNIEVIVVDGGSTDGTTVKLLQNMKRARTTFILREGQHLVGDNRNFGIALAKGRYICCLDADDTLDPTYIEKAVFHLETYGFDIVSTSINFVGFKEGHFSTMEYPTLNDMIHGNHILTCAVFRKGFWDLSSGFFDVGVGPHHVAEDWDFWIRLAAMGGRIRNISKEYLFNYRVHQGGSLSSASDVKNLSLQRESILQRNWNFLTSEAISRSDIQRSRNLRCEPDKTALVTSFNKESVTTSKLLLLAIPFSVMGGAERLLSGLVRFMVSKGWRIIVVTTLEHNTNLGSTIDWFKAITPEVYELRKFLEPEEAKDFVRYLIASRNPDCILNAGSRLIYEMLPEIKRSQKTISVVDLLFNTVGHADSHLEFKQYISATLAENKEVVEWLEKICKWPKRKIRKISSGVDLSLYAPTRRSLTIASALNIPDSDFVVGFSGRLSHEKGPDIFVQIARLCAGMKNLQFVMTGVGPMSESLLAEIKLLPSSVKFKYVGLVKDVKPYLAMYDVLILCSRLDGRPFVAMEAMACGVPVVASNIGAMPELIEEGINGYLAPVGDVEIFVDNIRSIAQDRLLLKQLKIGARVFAEKNLDDKLGYIEYEAALSEIIRSDRCLDVHFKSDV